MGRPAAADYLRVQRSGTGVRMRWCNARLHPFHPFDHVTVMELLERAAGRYRRSGSAFGDPEGGSPGFDVQTFIEEASPLSVRLRVDPVAAWVELARPVVRIVGAAARRVVVTVSRRFVRGRATRIRTQSRTDDASGNPVVLDSPVRLRQVVRRDSRQRASAAVEDPMGKSRRGSIIRSSFPESTGSRPAEAAARRLVPLRRRRSPRPGIHRLHARVDALADFATTSNPIRIEDGVSARAGPSTAEKVGTAPMLVWGDPHAQSVIGCGARTIDAYFRHARDFAATDFASHQANCFLVSGEEWAETERVTREMNDDGRFVALLGVEWSAASRLGGDHNLYFPETAPNCVAAVTSSSPTSRISIATCRMLTICMRTIAAPTR